MWLNKLSFILIFIITIFFLVFLFYYVWGLFYFLSYFFKDTINYIYLKFDKNFMMLKKDFNDLGFIEKLFLVLFSKNNTFYKSVGNIYSNNNLFNYRKKKYPLIFFFHLFSEKMNYKLPPLKFLQKFYKTFLKFKKSQKIFKKLTNFFFFKFNAKYSEKVKFYLIYLVLQKTLYKRYYNLCSSIYYKNFNINNLVKLNWVFYLFLIKSDKKSVIYDLSKYSDWYDFNFKKNKINKVNKIILDKKKKNILLKFRQNNINYLIKIYKHYNLFFKKINYIFNFYYKNIFIMSFKFFNDKKSKINLNSNFKKILKNFYTVRFSESSMSKYIELNNIKNYSFFYIRKNRIFNKGRYSRNRQLYRTGVYWCLWLNIILVYGLYFLFYRFTFNFGYFWWGLLILFYSTIFSRAIKYNYHNFYKIFIEICNFSNWLGFILYSFKNDFYKIFKNYKLFFNKNTFYFNIIKLLYNIYKNISKSRFAYFWEDINYIDNSFLRYKTFIHWFNQIYKVLTY